LAIYNWDSADVVQINIASLGFIKGDILKLTNAMDMDSDTVNLTYDGSGKINVNMKTHTAVKANASNQTPASQFPKFGAFILQKTGFNSNTGNNSYLFPSYWKISPNPNNGAFTISNASNLQNVNIYNALGQKVYSILNENVSPQIDVNISTMPNGMYTLQIESNGKWHTTKIILNK
jgi:hypothetical protein